MSQKAMGYNARAAGDEEFVVIVLSSEMMPRLETRRAEAQRLLTLWRIIITVILAQPEFHYSFRSMLY
jgi:hypothetical protein